jgi:hypothetical protein
MTQRIVKRLRSRGVSKAIVKAAPHGRTIEHLTETDLPSDRYRYYHATKGWRDRRAWGVTDHGLERRRRAGAA